METGIGTTKVNTMNGLDAFKLFIVILFLVWGYDTYTSGFTKDTAASLLLLIIAWLMYKFTEYIVRRGNHG